MSLKITLIRHLLYHIRNLKLQFKIKIDRWHTVTVTVTASATKF